MWLHAVGVASEVSCPEELTAFQLQAIYKTDIVIKRVYVIEFYLRKNNGRFKDTYQNSSRMFRE